MDFLYSDEPIIACSSGNNENCAISIIRLSGFDNLNDLNIFFTKNLKKIESRKAYFTKIKYQNNIYDEIVLTFFKAPNTYNGENILELSVHGNILNVERIINLFIKHTNFRKAYPGEFTYRALKNNKMSLSQVEGLDLLLNANSKFTLSQGFSLLSGKLQQKYLNLEKLFLKHKSSVELSIDFLDDVGEERANILFKDSLDDLIKEIESLKNHCDNQGYNLVEPEITLVGQPNAGKSTLFNKLLKDNRAIVSHIPGTTRDYISEKLNISNITFKLIDTAGIRETGDYIESQGIKSSIELIKSSFYKILLINPFEFTHEFFKQISNINFDLICFTHADLDGFDKNKNIILNKLKEELNFLQIGPMGAQKVGPIEPKSTGPMGAQKNGSIEPSIIDLQLNNDTIKNIDLVTLKIIEKYQGLTKNNPILLNRHKNSINKIYCELCDYKNLSEKESDISILSHELNAIGHCINELIGIVSPDDVLHNIFNNFCIGK